MRGLFSVVVLWGAVGTIAVRAAEKIDLRPHFKPGQNRYVEITDATVQQVSGAMIGNKPMTSRNRSVFGFFEEVLKSTDKLTQVRLTFDRRAVEVDHPMAGQMKYDTDNETPDAQPDPVGQALNPWIGQSVVLTIDPQGKVVQIDGIDKLRATLAKAAGGTASQQDEQLLTKDFLGTRLFEARYLVLPNREVAVGEEWTETARVPAAPLGTLISKYKCKLEKVEQRGDRKVAVIHYQVETTLDKSNAQPAAPGRPQPKIRQIRGEGTLYVDAATGLPIEQKSKSKAEIELSAEGPDGSKGAMKLDIVNDSEFLVRTLSPDQRKKEHPANKTP